MAKGSYQTKRDFSKTAEPPMRAAAPGRTAMFVVQKHAAHRAGLHWDFRLEHGGVLWSWAVPKGPSLDPADRRLAIHVEDHPVDYADFQGEIPAGQYGGGAVETWDRGTWEPLEDPDAGMRKGNLRFELKGRRLSGRFTLARLHARERGKPEGWFLIKGHDSFAREGIGALEMEKQVALPSPGAGKPTGAPAPGAKRGTLPQTQAPQLCAVAGEPPEGDDWLSEIKFDGYRLLVSIDRGKVRLLTRSGLDWAERMPAVAKEFARLDVTSAMIDGELVALRPDGVSSFPGLQSALKGGRDATLHFFAFDLLHLNGWDLRSCRLLDRKQALHGLAEWSGMLRYSDHVAGDAGPMRRNACKLKLEGIVCKRADAPYRAGRNGDWVKVKCQGREEFVVLGWTPPARSRIGFGALHLGYYDQQGALHYAGGVGSGYDDAELKDLRKRLGRLAAPPPPELQLGGEPVDATISWVRPELVVEVQYTDWSGAGRLRHGVYLGLREDKAAREVVRDMADPDSERGTLKQRRGVVTASRSRHVAVPPKAGTPTAQPAKAASVVVAKAPKKAAATVGGVEITHPDRALWPGITKRDLAAYWEAVAPHALPGLARRPLSILRCPEGIEGEKFFQKNGHGYLPRQIREGHAGGQPYLAIDDLAGLVAMAQMSAIELHAWGASEADPLHPDRLVFDLDPGEGVAFDEVVRAALEVRARLEKLELASFCRTTGGKGLHVVVPVKPEADWDRVKPFCRAFAELMTQELPDRFVAHVKIADRKGKILVDWLRNGLGATAVASFCPRARPGAGVATPLAWREVTPKLDPSAFTLLTVPARLAKLKADPWDGFDGLAQLLPRLEAKSAPARPQSRPTGTSRIVVASKPKKR